MGCVQSRDDAAHDDFFPNIQLKFERLNVKEKEEEKEQPLNSLGPYNESDNINDKIREIQKLLNL